jgi:tRNA (mo5U34)-methyltransferase
VAREGRFGRRTAAPVVGQPADAAGGGYGSRYELEPIPPGLEGEELQRYLGRMSWYHSIDFGGGVVSNGIKPLEVIEREWSLFGLANMRGRSLLDIGGVDGGYAFRAERAGASPVTVIDHYVWSADPDAYGRLYRDHVEAGTTPPAPHETELWDPEGLPGRWRFDTARRLLGSSVHAIAADFMECDLDQLGMWDVVLYLGVLYHMEDPLRAMRRVAATARHQALIETEAVVIPGHPEPLWRFFPDGELNHDRSNWWVPNLAALLGLLGAAGFANAEVLSGEPADDGAEHAGRHYRAIVRAIK